MSLFPERARSGGEMGEKLEVGELARRPEEGKVLKRKGC
jgi:hypothetical protein